MVFLSWVPFFGTTVFSFPSVTICFSFTKSELVRALLVARVILTPSTVGLGRFEIFVKTRGAILTLNSYDGVVDGVVRILLHR